VSHLGKADRYDEVMTAAYMTLIHRRMVERGDGGAWTAFAGNNPDLFAMRFPGQRSPRPAARSC
jgi:hypothetical protein